MLGLLAPLLTGVFGVIDKAVEDKDQAAAIKGRLQEMMLQGQLKEIEAAASIVVAEASGESWSQRNWRPFLMFFIMFLMAFNGVVVPLLEAFTDIRIPILEAWNSIPESMWDLLMLGVGGYVAGRSVEKGVALWKKE